MANHPQAIRRHRQSLERRTRNRHYNTMMKNAVKKLREAIDNNEGADALETLYRSATSTIDHVATKGVIKAQTAARKNSRLAQAVATAATAAAKAPAKKTRSKSKATARKPATKKTTKKSAAKSRK